jgi:hypothetical protein
MNHPTRLAIVARSQRSILACRTPAIHARALALATRLLHGVPSRLEPIPPNNHPTPVAVAPLQIAAEIGRAQHILKSLADFHAANFPHRRAALGDPLKW